MLLPRKCRALSFEPKPHLFEPRGSLEAFQCLHVSKETGLSVRWRALHDRIITLR